MTVMEIEDLHKVCVKETEDHLNRRILGNHKEIKRVCSIKNKSPAWAFHLPFWNLACSDGSTWYYCKLCHFVEPRTPRETTKGVMIYTK